MNYGNIKYNAVEDGTGIRTVLFVSGCRRHCPGCFQPQTWDFTYGKPFDDEAKQAILSSMEDPFVHGLTLLGGEPFEPENQKELLDFIRTFRERYPMGVPHSENGRTIWAYTGYTFEQLLDSECPANTRYTEEMLQNIDVLVDGPYKKEKHTVLHPFRGSSNQRILDLPESLIRESAVLSPHHAPRIKSFMTGPK